VTVREILLEWLVIVNLMMAGLMAANAVITFLQKKEKKKRRTDAGPKIENGLPPGTKVKMVHCLEAEEYPGRVWTTESKPFRIGSGAWIVLLEGYRYGFYVRCLEAVE
jgi:hypothetical protein